jgi:hypothetical protein
MGVGVNTRAMVAIILGEEEGNEKKRAPTS